MRWLLVITLSLPRQLCKTRRSFADLCEKHGTSCHVIGGWLQRYFLGCGVFSGRGASRTKTQCVPNAGQFQTIVIDGQDCGDDVGSVCTEDLRSSIALLPC
jgi:hypothetical protein